MFNQLYRKIIVQNAVQQDFQNILNRYKRLITTDDQFFKQYIMPLNSDNNLMISKSMQNTFRVQGKLKDVLNFFKNFKVDKKFLQKPSQFIIIAPSIVFSANSFGHNYNFDQGYKPQKAFDPYSTMSLNNLKRSQLQGRWMDLYQSNKDYQFDIRVKRCTPTELINHIKYNIERNGYNDIKDLYITVEFYVNCSGNMNGKYQETCFQIPFNKKITIADIANDHDKDEQPTVSLKYKNKIKKK